MITGKALEYEKFEEVIKVISKWIYDEHNLHKLLIIEPAPTFEVLLMFFTPEVSVILNNINLFPVGVDNRSNKDRVMVLIQVMVERIV